MIVDEVAALIKEFNWHDYGLDPVENTEFDDWAQVLARRICGQSGYVMVSHDVYLEMTRTMYGMATCTHPRYGRTGWCNTAGCVNNVNVAGTWVPARGEWIRADNEALRFACSHPEYKDGRCAVMSCHNYVSKHTTQVRMETEPDCGG